MQAQNCRAFIVKVLEPSPIKLFLQIPDIPFEKAFSRLFEAEDLGADHLFRGKRAVKSMSLKSMPEYLLVQIQRYYIDTATWSHKKRECTCKVPEEIDIEKYRAPKREENGVRPGETPMPEDASNSKGPDVDMELVAQLASMGFSENGCKRACIATKNAGVEVASEWIFAHMEDPDFNLPPETGDGSGGGISSGFYDKLLNARYVSCKT